MLFTFCKKDELNNGNSDPSKLTVGVSGPLLQNVLRLMKPGSTCTLPSSVSVTTEVEVRTGSVVNGQIVPDDKLYYDAEFTGPLPNNGPILNQQFDIKVPAVGAYSLKITYRINDCSNCCSGKSTVNSNFCGESGVGTNVCRQGKPKVEFMQIFTSSSRPFETLDPGTMSDGLTNALKPRACTDCDKCPTGTCN